MVEAGKNPVNNIDPDLENITPGNAAPVKIIDHTSNNNTHVPEPANRPSSSGYNNILLVPVPENEPGSSGNNIVSRKSRDNNSDNSASASGNIIDFGFNNELNKILNCIEGKKIVLFYKNNKKLNESLRNELVNLIIRNESHKPENETRFQITSNRFSQIAKAITNNFPKEQEHLFYRPYALGLPANGKLFSKYENFKKKYYSKTSEDKTAEKHQNVNSNEKIKFLTNNLGPWDKIEEFWRDTFESRRILEDAKFQNKLNEYFKTYPALKTTHGYQLLEIDFVLKYPEKANIFQETGETALKKIYHHVINLKKKDPEVVNLLEIYEQNPDLITLLILPYLLKVSYGRKRSGDKTLVKHTKKEISDSFMVLVSVSSL